MVYQKADTYTVSGTTLTFGVAPPTGVLVEARTHSQTEINTFPATGISGLTAVTPVPGDHMMILDATDSALKKADVKDIMATAVIITSAAVAVAMTFDSSENATFSANVTVTGDLTVTGDTIEQQVTNLNVEDKFILLNSGSAAADAGIVVNGAGSSLGWDQSAGRWALDYTGATWNQTTITSDAFVAAVVTSDDTNYQKVGNIRIDGSDIYIYV